jgi:MATE family multidrug resistance protein
VEPIIKNLLCFVAVYCIFDTGNIIFAAALKGAGDTRFVMLISVALSWLIMVLPDYFIIHYRWGPGDGLYLAWTFTSAYVCILAIIFWLRFLQGKWKTMRVIE